MNTFRACKKCGKKKTRVAVKAYANGSKFVDSKGRIWNGLLCPDCLSIKRRSAYVRKGKPQPTPIKEFILKRIKVAKNDCWEWQTKGIKPQGYAYMIRNGKIKYIHRLAYEIWVGPIPQGHFVCHRCDNRKCCNPEHLFTGTQKDNVQDALRKGRLSCGEAHAEIVRNAFKRKKEKQCQQSSQSLMAVSQRTQKTNKQEVRTSANSRSTQTKDTGTRKSQQYTAARSGENLPQSRQSTSKKETESPSLGGTRSANGQSQTARKGNLTK